MILLVLGLLCGALTVSLAAVYKAYEHVTATELKRRARSGDALAVTLYRAVAFGLSTKLVVAGLGILSAYASITLLERSVGVWYTALIVVLFSTIGTAFVLARGGASRASLWMAAKLSPALAWVIERINPAFYFTSRFARRLLPLHVHSGVYEKSDLIALLEQQKTQADNRIAPGEIDLLIHALAFGDKTVASVLTPKRMVRTVAANEHIGPILMGELHQTGHSRFPVHGDEHDQILGILYLHDLVSEKHTGTVQDVMRPTVRYVHEDFTLYAALQAFLKTKQHLFIVVNSFEEYVGIVTVEDIIEQIIGRQIMDEFDQYEDLRTVAAAAAKKEHAAHRKDEAVADTAVTPTSEQSEMVQ